MTDEENPPSVQTDVPSSPVEAMLVSESDSDAHPMETPASDSVVVEANVVEAELVQPLPVSAPLDCGQVNLAATGGAVASVVLGVLSILGSTVTSYSVINALLGLVLGFWGMSSNVRWPWLGLALCLFGIVCCMVAAGVS